MDKGISESLASLSIEELQRYYVQLQKQSSNNKEEIAKQKALLEEAKKELSRLIAEQQVRVDELEMLQSDKQLQLKQLKEKIAASIQKLEEDNQQQDNHLNKLTSEYRQKLTSCKNIEENIQKLHEENDKKMPNDNMSIFEKNLIYKQHYDELLNMINDLENELETVVNTKEMQYSKLQQYQEEVRVLKEQCECNQISLKEANALKTKLEVELSVLNVDYQNLNQNSNTDLPNEVNNENILHENLVKITDECLESKSKCDMLSTEKQSMLLENIHIQNEIQNNQNAQALDIQSIQTAYKSAVKTLEDATIKLKGILKDRTLMSSKILSATDIDVILDHKQDDKIEIVTKQFVIEDNINSDYEFRLIEALKVVQQLKGKVNDIKEKNEEIRNIVKAAQEAEDSENNETRCICNLQDN